MEVKASTTRLLMQLILKSLVQSSEFRGVREEDIGLMWLSSQISIPHNLLVSHLCTEPRSSILSSEGWERKKLFIVWLSAQISIPRNLLVSHPLTWNKILKSLVHMGEKGRWCLLCGWVTRPVFFLQTSWRYTIWPVKGWYHNEQ